MLLLRQGHHGKGVVDVALKGAIAQIKRRGGGRIEAFPEDTEGRTASPALLFNGSLSMFGLHKWVVTRTVR